MKEHHVCYRDTQTHAVEPFSDALWVEILPLLEAHFQEMPHREIERFDPDRDLYRQLDAIGALRIYTVRQGGVLVGYAVPILHRSLWYKGILESSGTVLYLTPAARQGWTAMAFLRFVEDQLDAEGVRVRHLHAHVGRREGVLYRRLGYRLTHEEYEKETD